MELSWKTCLRAGVTAFLLYLAIHYGQGAMSLAGMVVSAAAPLFIGGVAAYILNLLMSFYEKHYFVKKHTPAVAKSRRPVCLVLSMLTLAVIVAAVILLVVPQLVSAIRLLWAEVPGALERLTAWLQGIEWLPQEVRSFVEGVDWRSRLGDMARMITSGLGSAVNVLVSTVSSVFSGAVTTLLSTIFAIYLLSGKERLGQQCHRLLRFALKPAWYERFCHVFSVVDDSFRRYIVGQCTEALILGGLCTLGMLLLKLPTPP